jgi:hypothetical protein
VAGPMRALASALRVVNVLVIGFPPRRVCVRAPALVFMGWGPGARCRGGFGAEGMTGPGFTTLTKALH